MHNGHRFTVCQDTGHWAHSSPPVCPNTSLGFQHLGSEAAHLCTPCSFQSCCIFHSHFSPQTINPLVVAGNCYSSEAAHQDFPTESREATDLKHLVANWDESAPARAGEGWTPDSGNSSNSHVNHSDSGCHREQSASAWWNHESPWALSCSCGQLKDARPRRSGSWMRSVTCSRCWLLWL